VVTTFFLFRIADLMTVAWKVLRIVNDAILDNGNIDLLRNQADHNGDFGNLCIEGFIVRNIEL
jgi:hypothetical protein